MPADPPWRSDRPNRTDSRHRPARRAAPQPRAPATLRRRPRSPRSRRRRPKRRRARRSSRAPPARGTRCAETWLPDARGFVFDGQLARSWLRRVIAVIQARELAGAADCIELHVRSWEASRPGTPTALCDAVRGVLRAVITEVRLAAALCCVSTLARSVCASDRTVCMDSCWLRLTT